MKPLQIFTNNQISIDGKQTGYSVYQQDNKTVVYEYATGQQIQMPMTRYALSTKQGRDLFQRHFLDSLSNMVTL
jgi:hypothetical protein